MDMHTKFIRRQIQKSRFIVEKKYSAMNLEHIVGELFGKKGSCIILYQLFNNNPTLPKYYLNFGIKNIQSLQNLQRLISLLNWTKTKLLAITIRNKTLVATKLLLLNVYKQFVLSNNDGNQL